MKRKPVLKISVEDISHNLNNHRVTYERDKLYKSIAKFGIRTPVTVYVNAICKQKIKYILLSGERRWRCAKRLGIKTIPAKIIDKFHPN